MSVVYTSEKIYGYPIPSDGISFDTISVNGITTYIGINNTIFSGNYSYDKVSITLKGIDYPAPISKPNKDNITQSTFIFRDRTWKIIDTIEGYKFRIGSYFKLDSWTVIAIAMDTPRLKI